MVSGTIDRRQIMYCPWWKGLYIGGMQGPLWMLCWWTMRKLPTWDVLKSMYVIGLIGESEFWTVAPVSVACVDTGIQLFCYGIFKISHIHSLNRCELLWQQFPRMSNFCVLLLNLQNDYSTITTFNYHPQFASCLPYSSIYITPWQTTQSITGLQSNLMSMKGFYTKYFPADAKTPWQVERDGMKTLSTNCP